MKLNKYQIERLEKIKKECKEAVLCYYCKNGDSLDQCIYSNIPSSWNYSDKDVYLGEIVNICKNEEYNCQNCFYYSNDNNGDFCMFERYCPDDWEFDKPIIIDENIIHFYENSNTNDIISAEENKLTTTTTTTVTINQNVNHPSHYTDGKIEVIDFIEDKQLGFHLGNAVKYIARAGKKANNPIEQDLKKAIWYLERKIEEVSKDD